MAHDPERINRLTTGVYELGSTFKAFTLAMALDSGKYDLNSLWDARGPLHYGKFTIHDDGRQLAVTPLMLVQVEDQIKGGDDPVARVREKLEQAGVPADKIKSHTSGEPDPEFHTLAYDPLVEVLIFKVAVATGFDAPRAWTLVSVRPNRGKEFGLQIVGRIMRVPPLVRPFHGQDPLLDRGYVFLTDADLQAGLNAAVEEIKAVRHGMELITDQLDIVQFGNTQSPLGDVSISGITLSERPKTSAERQERLALLIDAGLVEPELRNKPDEEQDRAILTFEMIQKMGDTPLFGDLPLQSAPDSTGFTNTKQDIHVG